MSGWSFTTTDRNVKFCPECNNYLETFTQKEDIICPCCDYSTPIKNYEYQPTVR